MDRIHPEAIQEQATPAALKVFTMKETVLGKTVFELNADTAQIDAATNTMKGTNVVMVGFDKLGERVSRLTAREGSMSSGSNDMEARGAVVVKSQSGTELHTELLFWSQSTEKITTPSEVLVIQKDNIMRGKGMTSDLGLDQVIIDEPVATVADLEALKAEQESLAGPSGSSQPKP